jgi:hypothetical protein
MKWSGWSFLMKIGEPEKGLLAREEFDNKKKQILGL